MNDEEEARWHEGRVGFRYTALVIAVLIVIAVSIALAVGLASAHGNVSVYSYGTNYIIWDVGGNTLVWIDGTETAVSGLTFGQYELQPGTEHIACNVDGNCTGIITKPDSMTVLLQWGAYLVVVIFILLSVLIPYAVFPGVLYSMYLVGVYMPDIEATGNEYIFVSCLIGLMLIGAFLKYRRS